MPLSESSYLPPAAFVLSHVLGIAGVLYWRSRSREDERDRVQKKTFTKWVNKHLMKVRKHINDLYEDLRDGHNLISLLEVLSGVKLPVEPPAERSLRLVRAPAWCRASSEEREEEDDDDEEPREKGRMRFHRLQNVQIALDFLKQRQVKLVNIRNDDITDGNPKLTLGLIWTIILHFQGMMFDPQCHQCVGVWGLLSGAAVSSSWPCGIGYGVISTVGLSPWELLCPIFLLYACWHPPDRTSAGFDT
ncbi:microtubule-actin cross-linking factor 1-like isoform X1 [Pitangus sulphuratus]|nr:microtubule-actin cross-linking factor 1-like isoform X1 [Pitangus sulphuratus]